MFQNNPEPWWMSHFNYGEFNYAEVTYNSIYSFNQNRRVKLIIKEIKAIIGYINLWTFVQVLGNLLGT